jgi:sugar lactone lactonase YvrE
VLGALSGAALAEFIPGRIYISNVRREIWQDVPEEIWEFDPATGQSRVFADAGALPGIQDLVFTPDGGALRAALFWSNTIGAFDQNGNLTTALGPDDGIVRPRDTAYDRAGNFFVLTGQDARLLRFPPDGGPPTVVADYLDGILSGGPLAAAPNGDLYYGFPDGYDVMRITPDGVTAPFVHLPQGSIGSLAVDSQGNVFIATGWGVYRVDGGNPDTLHFLSPVSAGVYSFANIRLSPDESLLWMNQGRDIYGINPIDGNWSRLGQLPDHEYYHYGTGMAVYVPEPASLTLLGCCAVWFTSRVVRRRG